MKRIGRISYFFFLTSVLCSEPSAFELQSGATKKELKTIQSTNKNLENLAIDYNVRIQVLEQSKDGMQSVLDGQALRIKTLLDAIGQQDAKIQDLRSSLDYQSSVLHQHNIAIEDAKKAIEQITAKLSDLTVLVTKLNQDILKELDVLIKNNNQMQTEKVYVDKNNPVQTNIKSNEINDFAGISNKEILNQAKKLYREKNILESKKYYEKLVQNNYRKASSLYMLGEIEYQLGNFTEAIDFYKKSTSLDDKASYMPILLWHTAWAFRYSKDMYYYNKFLDSLIRLYPESEQGKKAKDLRQKTTK